MNPNIWYHIVPKRSDMSKGIISPFYMFTHGLDHLAYDSTAKYRERMVNSWNIYPGRTAKSLSMEEVMNGLNKFRGEYGTRAIYAFKYPPASQMGPNMEKILRYKDVYEINISMIPDLIKIDYDVNDGPNEEWYNIVKPIEYFSRYDDNAESHGKLLFAGIPHVAIITESGKIPPQAIRKLNYFPLYHGSNKKLPLIKRHIAPAFPDDNVVFATPLYEFALAYSGNRWNDLSINQSIFNDQHILTEILPGSFEKTFNIKGYIHYISSEGFYRFTESKKEWVSIWDAKPYKIETLPNVWNALKKSNTILYNYPNLPEYIPNREKYIYNICKKWNIDPKKYLNMIKE